MNKKETALLLGLIFTFLLSLCAQSVKDAQSVRDNTLRLHIIGLLLGVA